MVSLSLCVFQPNHPATALVPNKNNTKPCHALGEFQLDVLVPDASSKTGKKTPEKNVKEKNFQPNLYTPKN